MLAGTSPVHAETIIHLRTMFKCYNTPLLNELRGGDLHGYSREEIKVSGVDMCIVIHDIMYEYNCSCIDTIYYAL